MTPVIYDVLKKKKNDKPTCSQIKRKLFEKKMIPATKRMPIYNFIRFFNISVLYLYFPS